MVVSISSPNSGKGKFTVVIQGSKIKISLGLELTKHTKQ